jgi:small subunit ribosomal protein S20
LLAAGTDLPLVIDNHLAGENNTPLFGSACLRKRLIPDPDLDGINIVANIKSARKRARQADKRRLLKMGQRSKMRTSIKAVITAVEKGDKDAAAAAYQAAVPVIDSMITKGIVNKNKAARHKSRLNKMVKALAA